MTTEVVHEIHPQLRGLAVPISSLEPDSNNAREHDDRNIEQILHSFREHGQRKPIVVQRRGDRHIVRAGNGSLEAVKRLGWTHVAAVICEESDAEAVTYAIRDNRTAELAAWNPNVLVEQLSYLEAEGVNLSETGWEPYEYEPLAAAVDAWEPPGSDEEAEDTVMPERRVSLMFTRAEWTELTELLTAKPSAALVLARIRGSDD